MTPAQQIAGMLGPHLASSMPTATVIPFPAPPAAAHRIAAILLETATPDEAAAIVGESPVVTAMRTLAGTS